MNKDRKGPTGTWETSLNEWKAHIWGMGRGTSGRKIGSHVRRSLKLCRGLD